MTNIFKSLRTIFAVVLAATLPTTSCAFFPGAEKGATASLAVFRGSGVSGAPSYVIAGGNADLHLWTSGSTLEQLYVKSHDNDVAVRVIVDPFDGAPRVVIDDVTGTYGVYRQVSEDRLDLYIFDADNAWVDGAMLRRNGSRYERARILGLPAFTGQIRGDLSEGELGTGSFAVIADEADTLADVTDVTDEMDAIMTALAASAGGQALFGSFAEALRVGGIVVLVGALIPPVNGAYAAAGVAMTVVGWFTNDIATGIETGFQSDVPLANELRDIAVGFLREPGRRGPLETLSDIVQGVKDFAADPLGDFGDGFELPSFEEESYSGDDISRVDSADEPAGGEPPSLPVDVTGQAVWQDNTVDPIVGTVDDDGTLTLESDDGALTIEGDIVSGSLDGTWTRPDETGVVTGTVEAIAACEAVQASGGQGAFTNVHFVGAGSGDVEFFYDAYTVPDAFTVSVGGATRFSTGALVSGSQTAIVSIAGEQFVFVSVSAPESGTSWEYALSCLP